MQSRNLIKLGELRVSKSCLLCIHFGLEVSHVWSWSRIFSHGSHRLGFYHSPSLFSSNSVKGINTHDFTNDLSIHITGTRLAIDNCLGSYRAVLALRQNKMFFAIAISSLGCIRSFHNVRDQRPGMKTVPSELKCFGPVNFTFFDRVIESQAVC